jgi:hypothetical protein
VAGRDRSGEDAGGEGGPPARGHAGRGKGGKKGQEEEAMVTRGEDSCSVEITVPVESPKLMMLEVSAAANLHMVKSEKRVLFWR